MIDRKGKWPKGADAKDLARYIREHASGGYEPDRVEHAMCPCGVSRFSLEMDDETGFARRTCAACEKAALMLDSAEYADEASPEECACPCGKEVFEIAVGFAHRTDKSIKWVSIGCRCVACGVLGVYGDWKIDYEPYDHLYTAV